MILYSTTFDLLKSLLANIRSLRERFENPRDSKFFEKFEIPVFNHFYPVQDLSITWLDSFVQFDSIVIFSESALLSHSNFPQRPYCFVWVVKSSILTCQAAVKVMYSPTGRKCTIPVWMSCLLFYIWDVYTMSVLLMLHGVNKVFRDGKHPHHGEDVS